MADANDSKDGKSSQTQPVKVELTSITPGAKKLDEDPILYATSEKGRFIKDPHDKDYMELVLRSGQHSELVQNILRQRIELRAKDFPRWPASSSGGTRIMWIESRFWYDRERLLPDFDDDWRRYRAQYLHSLELDPREPVHVPEFEADLINPIRRFYMRGGDWLENKIISKFAKDKHFSSVYRFVFTRSLMLFAGFVGASYYCRFWYQTWETRNGPFLFITRPIVYPNHPKFPFKDFKTEPGHHHDLSFSRRSIYKDLRDYEDRTVVI